ncbi:MAG: DUF7522 family protein [Halobacteriota archaeon]
MAQPHEGGRMNDGTADTLDALVDAARAAIGDDLRSVTYFTPTEWEQIYLRDDLVRDAQLDRFVRVEREGFGERNAYGATELGSYRFTIHAFEHGYLVRVIRDGHGVFVTTDSLTMHLFEEVATALAGVLTEYPVSDLSV